MNDGADEDGGPSPPEVSIGTAAVADVEAAEAVPAVGASMAWAGSIDAVAAPGLTESSAWHEAMTFSRYDRRWLVSCCTACAKLWKRANPAWIWANKGSNCWASCLACGLASGSEIAATMVLHTDCMMSAGRSGVVGLSFSSLARSARNACCSCCFRLSVSASLSNFL